MIRKKTGKTKTQTRAGTTETRFINFKSRGFLLLVVLFIFILILAFFFGEGGIIEIITARARIETLRKDIAGLEKERDALLKEIEELKKNPLALEKKAREKLWLMKKNEKVVVIVKDKDKEKEGQDKK